MLKSYVSLHGIGLNKSSSKLFAVIMCTGSKAVIMMWRCGQVQVIRSCRPGALPYPSLHWSPCVYYDTLFTVWMISVYLVRVHFTCQFATCLCTYFNLYNAMLWRLLKNVPATLITLKLRQSIIIFIMFIRNITPVFPKGVGRTQETLNIFIIFMFWGRF